MKNRRNQRGISVISIALATAVLLTTLFAVLSGLAANRKTSLSFQRRVAADAYASELLEFFASLSAAQLVTFMQAPAVDKMYCTQYNHLDRTVTPNVLLEPDPIANLTNPFSLGGPSAEANRSYVIQVVALTATSVTVQDVACGKNPSQYSIQPNEGFLVSVEVTWMRDGTMDRALVSTLIPVPMAGP